MITLVPRQTENNRRKRRGKEKEEEEEEETRWSTIIHTHNSNLT